ncbi:PREDICTED: RNA-binding protein MEX3B [Charadrius vociferus]|uniref:RNA-binding protein MEX3B n=1 Tax=Charadrius vociferus TaxID=50402 RepID=UPI000521B82B|nr:PREDICTED: RNA-binding protein MEX3B [Charadrius vociferus]
MHSSPSVPHGTETLHRQAGRRGKPGTAALATRAAGCHSPVSPRSIPTGDSPAGGGHRPARNTVTPHCTQIMGCNRFFLPSISSSSPSPSPSVSRISFPGCKIKALRAKTNTYIKTPVRGEEPLFVVTGRKEDVAMARREIISAAEHFSMIRASRNKNTALNGTVPGPPNLPGQTTIQVRVPYRVVGLVVGPKGATIKRIQQQTHTYIVTPSRDKEPVFEVTGMPENVDRAREEIEAHIAMRTGGIIELTDENDFHANGTDVGFELNGTGSLWSKPWYGRRSSRSPCNDQRLCSTSTDALTWVVWWGSAASPSLKVTGFVICGLILIKNPLRQKMSSIFGVTWFLESSLLAVQEVSLLRRESVHKRAALLMRGIPHVSSVPQALCPSCRVLPLKPFGIRCSDGCWAVTELAQQNTVTLATEMASRR